jgi:hypothetical protein
VVRRPDENPGPDLALSIFGNPLFAGISCVKSVPRSRGATFTF